MVFGINTLLLCLRRETEPDWDQEIATDVTEECSKYGPVSHTHVDKNSKVRLRISFQQSHLSRTLSVFLEEPRFKCKGGTAGTSLDYLVWSVVIKLGWGLQGFVYLKFVTVEGSAAAQKALHGRWFAGRQVVAEFQFTQIYNNFFHA